MITEALLKNDFLKLEDLLNKSSLKETEKCLVSIAFDLGSIVIYSAICMMLMKKETAGLHYLAAEIISQPLCHFEGAYAAALYHVRKAIELDPKDKGLKEVLIFLHKVPDQVVSKEEAILVAKQLLEEDPDNKCAQDLLNWYGL